MGTPSGPRVLPLALLPLIAVGLGVVAVLLVGPVASSTLNWGGPDLGLGPLPSVPTVVIVWVVALVFLAWVGYAIVQRVLGRSLSVPSRSLAVAFAAIVAGLLFVLLLHFAASATPPPGQGTSNTTSGPPPPGAPVSHPGLVGGSPTPASWPWWVTVGILGGVVVAVGLVAALASRARPAPPPAPTAREPDARSVVASALETLRLRAADDPRAAIILAYAQLLQAIGSRAGAPETLTARELIVALVQGLGFRAPAAERLTTLFELARYSTQPLPAAAPAQAREALREALRELGAPLWVP
jgi:hypothetical protein